MGELDTLIEKYIHNINVLMKHRTSNKLLYNLKSEVSLLFLAMDMSGVMVKIPERILFNLEKGNDELVDKRIKDFFVNEFYSSNDLNVRISEISDYLYNYFGEGYILDYQRLRTLDDIIKISNDFFDYYDTDIRDFYVKKLYDDKIFFINTFDKKYDGMTFPLPSQNDSFILSGYNGTINSALTLVHEVMHSYIDKYKNETYDELLRSFINNLGESYSKFIEYVFMHYLHEINFFERDIRPLEVNGDVNLMGFLSDYKANLSCLDPEEIYDEDDMFVNYMDSEKYSYGQIIGFNYFLKYLENESKVKDDIFQFSLDDGKYDKTYLLNNYGLTDKEITNPKKLVKEMKRHFNY